MRKLKTNSGCLERSMQILYATLIAFLVGSTVAQTVRLCLLSEQIECPTTALPGNDLGCMSSVPPAASCDAAAQGRVCNQSNWETILNCYYCKPCDPTSSPDGYTCDQRFAYCDAVNASFRPWLCAAQPRLLNTSVTDEALARIRVCPTRVPTTPAPTTVNTYAGVSSFVVGVFVTIIAWMI